MEDGGGEKKKKKKKGEKTGNQPLIFSNVASGLTFDFCAELLGFPHEKGSSLAVERVCWVGVVQELRQERLKDVQQV